MNWMWCVGGRTEKSLVAPTFLAGKEERPHRFRCQFICGCEIWGCSFLMTWKVCLFVVVVLWSCWCNYVWRTKEWRWGRHLNKEQHSHLGEWEKMQEMVWLSDCHYSIITQICCISRSLWMFWILDWDTHFLVIDSFLNKYSVEINFVPVILLDVEGNWWIRPKGLPF